MEDAGLSTTSTTTPEGSRPGSSASTSTATSTVTAESRRQYSQEKPIKSSASSAGEEEKIDPVQEFLRKKRLESDAHLMMLCAN